MKKYIVILLALCLVLSLAACGNTAGSAGSAGGQSPQSGGQTAGEDIPFGKYRTEEALLELLESGDMTEYLSADPEMPSEAVDTGGDEPYSGFSNAIVFTDGGDAEGVEYPDFKSQLSPEMQKEWEEMEQAMTDPEFMEMGDLLG